ncbi:MAG: hypothetical protein GWP06_09980 [Actinobacteria bacterium]|nr:hypothetical protein [Actinomycetota bacterium]
MISPLFDKKLLFFTLILIISWSRTSNAFFLQKNQDKPKERMRLIHADELRGETFGKQFVRRLIGNVKFEQGSALVTCREAQEFVNEGKIIFYGNVSFIDQSKALYGDRIVYYRSQKLLVARGNVKLVDSTKILTADDLQYFEQDEKAIADHHVVLADTSERMTLTGKHVEYFRNKAYAKIIGQPVFSRLDSLAERRLVITGDLMEMFDDGERVKVLNNVKVKRGEVTANCGALEFFRSEEKIALSVEPTAYRFHDVLFGDKIDLILVNNEVKEIHVLGEAIVSSKVDSSVQTTTPYDLLTGEKILVSLKDELIDTVKVMERATSFYHVIEDSVEQGINKVLGDDLQMIFLNGELETVKVQSSPSTSVGNFYPPNSYAQVENELVALLTKIGIRSNAPADTVMSVTKE